MNHQDAALNGMTKLTDGFNQDPESKKSFDLATTDLQAFLDKHQYYGEAAVMLAALTLAQDEEPDSPPEAE
jgi:hypothetical protein